jgi:CMP-N,N'-diacetyllegionaminic acid synthase
MIGKQDKKVLGIIPAGRDNRTLPNKNIYPFKGRPVIEYAIECGLHSSTIDRVMVSTDDEEIAEIARKVKAEVPFLRPKELSIDSAHNIPVMKHAANYLIEEENWRPDIIVLVWPTYPFRRPEDIDLCVEKLITTDCDSVQSVSLASDHPYFLLLVGDEDIPKPYVIGNNVFEKFDEHDNLRPIYRANGLVGVTKADQVLMSDKFYGSDTRVAVMDTWRTFDIDTLHKLDTL